VELVASGRVFSIFFIQSLIPSLIGLIGIGFFADGLGITNSFIACGTILVGILSFTYTLSALRLGKG
jgi:DHA3 family macrolide efflux protein-like MFS transporter